MLKINKSLIRFIIIFALVFSIQFFINSNSYAGMLGDRARGEGAQKPIEIPDEVLTEIPTQSTQEVVKENYTIVPIFTSIEGNVLEVNPTTSDFGSDSEKGVPGVIFDIGYSSCVSDEEGKFSFKPPVGTYSVNMEYGNAKAALEIDSSLNISDILKYNGHDYVVSQISGTENKPELSVTRHEIIQSKKGASQVYILLDMSISMTSEKVIVNGVEKTKLQASVDAAKTLIHNLLSEGKNIYVGLIVYAGECYRAASLTKDELYLYEKLDEVINMTESTWYGYTDFTAALDKAVDSFYIDDSDPDYLKHCNRNIVFITDGIPTKQGGNAYYSDDSEEHILHMLKDIIGPNTRKRLEEVVAEGINVMSLISPETDTETVEYIESIFKGAVTSYEMAKDEQDLLNRIKNSIQDFIIRTLEEGNIEYTDQDQAFIGYEDPVRREQVTNNYDNIFYYNHEDTTNVNNGAAKVGLFTALDTDPTSITPEIEKLCDLTYMDAEVVKSIRIESVESVFKRKKIEHAGKRVTLNGKEILVERFVKTDEDGNDIYELETRYKVIELPYNLYVHLLRNQTGTLQTKVTATGLKITLNEGTVLSFKERDMDDPVPLLEVLDDDVAQGATVQIEYTIEVRNNSAMQFSYIQLVDYFPKDFLFDTTTPLLSERGTNAKYGWYAIEIDKDINDLTKSTLFGDGLITQESLDKYSDHKTAVVLTLNNNGDGENGFYIPAGYTKDKVLRVKLVVSRVISSAEDLSADGMLNDVEILSYKNNAKRRLTVPLYTDERSMLGVFPGDSKEYDDFADALSGFFQRGYKTGIDYAHTSNNVLIVPPTGLSSKDTFSFNKLFSIHNFIKK